MFMFYKTRYGYLSHMYTAFRAYQNENYIIKICFVRPEGSKARADITGINFRIFILIFVENCL